ncbi:YlbF family regulator [Aureibacillus halotolerans]|uniref:Cell fate (Sporulation/competence/biofilm development) regulator YlbF (YheA/YmcA/DUF963 family) n=1 Tax=Aureibacillus halotolerans TaxID=1508390 RepID=A0A4R6U958_9BACI|nr:YlbF family regulator [Aureibacillus halotolerans]TDQ42302.1 cell fate (sporulation/competence/biofilm development) regulator YlbF (YheA/YmcA/DUF963 family) [Aureibacillus halotolerans]
MIATNESVEVLEQVDHVGTMIVQSECAHAYHYARKTLAEDNEAQSLIREFGELKVIYEEVQRFGHYHPDYKKVMGEMRDLKRALDTQTSIARYKKCEDELQQLLTDVAQAFGGAVSDHIKIPTGNPFFDNMSSCSGGCGSGGSCGCS